MKYFAFGVKQWIGSILVFILLISVACGSSATSTGPAPTATATPTAETGAEGESGVPTATPTPESAPTEGVEVRGGTLNVGNSELGVFEGHPSLTSAPRLDHVASTVGEGTVTILKDLSAAPMLAESWEISDDFSKWTFHLQKGVQFHKGYGEMTAEDWVYSYRQWAAGALHARANYIDQFLNDPGSVKIIDDYTVEVDAGQPWVDTRIYEFMRDVGGAATWVVSKAQSDELGAEAAGKDIAATGPWEIVEQRTGEFWKFKAVPNHWRQTPYFDELVLWEVPEESARVAGFQTGKLDTFDMAFDSIPAVEKVEGARLIQIPNAGNAGLNIYGQLYTGLGTPDQYPSYNPDLPWVSSDPDTTSEAWAKARKVREAMSIAIDRQSIVDTLLSGYGAPIPMRDWVGYQDRMPAEWNWEYNPDRAKQLLEEAGGDGFSFTLTPAIRGAPAEVEACEAVAQMWQAVGIDVKLQRIPYNTLRPSIISRNYIGATCHSVSVRLDPVIGTSNYIKDSVFSYGTEHPWLEDHVTDAIEEVDPEERWRKTTEIYQWMFDNVMAFGLYSFDAVWPAGPRIEEWQPVSYADLRIPNGFELIRPRQQ